MTNIFRNTDTFYFQVPTVLVVEGIAHQLSPSALRMLLVLYCEAQRLSKGTLRIKNDLFGMNPKTLDKARRELVKWKLITVVKEGGMYVYTILNPQSGRPPAPRDKQQVSTSGSAVKPPAAGSLRLSRIIDQLSPAEMLAYYESRLQGKKRRRAADGFMVCCPFHNDTNPSLHVRVDEGVWYCHGCNTGGGILDFEQALTGQETGDIAPRLVKELSQNLGSPSKAEAIYSYVDEHGKLQFQVLRFGGKKFKQRHLGADGDWIYSKEGVRNVPYRLPELLAADVVGAVEGEKDADTGYLATAAYHPQVSFTTAAQGVWPLEFGRYFRGKKVFIIPDNDAAGRRYAEAVLASVRPHAIATKIVELPVGQGGDTTEYIDQHSGEELIRLVRSVPWRSR